MNGKQLFSVGLGVILLACGATTAEEIPVDSKVEAVTLYRGQAMVTREVSLPNESGELELIVGDLPAQVAGASLHASGGDGITIRSVLFRSRAVADEPKKEVAELDKQMKELHRKLKVNTEMMKLAETKSKFIGKLEGFTAATAKSDAERASLDPKAIGQMTSQIFEQHTELTKERTKLREEAEDIKEQIELLQRKRAELTRGRTRTVREAVIFISKAERADGSIRLRYLVGSATWSPAYNMRVGEEGKKCTVEYLAQVRQISGEDWSAVKLTLSTATPGMNAQCPLLVPFWINLRGPARSNDGGGFDYYDAQYQAATKQTKAAGGWQTAAGQDELVRYNWDLNRFAAESQSLELNVEKGLIRAGAMGRRAVEAGLAVSYSLEGPMSLASRSDSQLVQIAKIELPAESYHVATPVLSTFVHRVAKVTNTSPLHLLAGRYSAYIEGEFAGRGNLSIVAQGQKFIVGLGVDTQLRCDRELMEKSDDTAWGTRVQKFNYRLRVENYKDRPVAVRLLDRMPTTTSEEINISLGKVSDELSKDEVYIRDFKDRGILRWDLTIAANASGAKARDVTYSFEMRYAKDVHIGKQAVAAEEEMRSANDAMLLSQ